MISFVVSGISVRNAFRILASVAVSTALVLSSRIRIFRFFQQCSCDTETLFLTAGYVRSALLYVGVVAFRHPVDKFIGARQAADSFALFFGSVFITPAEVVENRTGKQYVFLQNNGYFISQSFHIVGTDILSADFDGAFRDIVQTADQVDKTRLRTSGSADDTDGLTGFDRQG